MTPIINNPHTTRNQMVSTRSIQSRIQKSFDENITKKYQQYKRYLWNAFTHRTTRRLPNITRGPAGITNYSKNCWCISGLQLLCNTPIGSVILSSKKFSKDFPEITHFMKLYYRGNSSPNLLGGQIRLIRKEIHRKLSCSFKEEQFEPGDAREFLNLLLSKYTFSHGFKFSSDPTDLVTLLSTAKEKYLFIETGSFPPELNLRSLFSSTPYELQGLIFYLPRGKHYIASVQAGGKWYKCNDKVITEVSIEDLVLRKNIVLLMASRQ